MLHSFQMTETVDKEVGEVVLKRAREKACLFARRRFAYENLPGVLFKFETQNVRGIIFAAVRLVYLPHFLRTDERKREVILFSESNLFYRMKKRRHLRARSRSFAHKREDVAFFHEYLLTTASFSFFRFQFTELNEGSFRFGAFV